MDNRIYSAMYLRKFIINLAYTITFQFVENININSLSNCINFWKIKSNNIFCITMRKKINSFLFYRHLLLIATVLYRLSLIRVLL